MKKIFSVMIGVALCLAVTFIFPQLSKSNDNVDDTTCLTCHTLGDVGGSEGLHGNTNHSDCTQCHAVTGDTPASSACSVCHLEEDPGECSIVNFSTHGSSCITCHPDCEEDGETTTTTTAATGPCPSEAIYGEYSEEAELLRDYRDNVLSKTQEGQKLIELYYKMSPMIVTAMEKNEKFKEIVKNRIDAILPLIEAELAMQ
jgi:hypothetical protein